MEIDLDRKANKIFQSPESAEKQAEGAEREKEEGEEKKKRVRRGENALTQVRP